MSDAGPVRRKIFGLENFFAVTLVGAAIYIVIFVLENGYLPQPFFYSPSDTFADWFNPANWARAKGAFDVFEALYPPLSFVFLRIFGIDSCYDLSGVDASVGYAARSCDWFGVATIIGTYFLDIALVYFSFKKRNPSRALVRTIGIGLGFPLLSGVERGNLIIVTFACVILAFGPFLRSSRLRSLAAACAVNFKIYLIAAVMSLLFKRRWRWVEITLLTSAIIYLATYAVFGSGTPLELYNNILNFNDITPENPLALLASGSYKPHLTFLMQSSFPSVLALGSNIRDAMLFILPAVMMAGKACIIAAFVATALRPEAVPIFRLVGLAIILGEISSEVGAYTIALHTFFVFLEPWRGFGRKSAIIICYIAAIPIEIPLQKFLPDASYSYIANRTVITYAYIGLTPFIRPLLTILVGVLLSMTTIRQVWLDIRHQGWSQRWRFRRDKPLLARVQRPMSPRLT